MLPIDLQSHHHDAEYLKSGYGLINISASLMYLNYLNTTYSDVNSVAKITPNILPIKPYDLVNFPGDHQLGGQNEDLRR